MTITLILSALKAVEFASYLISIYREDLENDTRNEGEGKKLVISSFIAPLIQSLCYFTLTKIYTSHREFGIHTSGSVWFYLFGSTVCETVEYYSIVAQIRPALFNDVEQIVKLAHFPFLLVLFVLECKGDTPNQQQATTDSRPESPEVRASFFSSISFWWFNNFLWFGYKSQLELGNLWPTLRRDQTDRVVPILRREWMNCKPSTKRPKYMLADGQTQQFNSIIKVLLKLFWPRLLLAAFLKLIHDLLQFVTPILLKLLLEYIIDPNAPIWHGLFYASLFLVIPTLQSIVLGNYFYVMQVIGNQVRSMIMGAVYRKSMMLSGNSRIQSTSGEIVNLMAVDSQRFQDLILYINLLWSAPFQIIVAIVLLYRELGWPVFAGVACMALFLPCNAFLAGRIKLLQTKMMKTKDERIKQMNEILSGIKVLKLYAWENSFIANLFGYRNRELRFLNRIVTLDALQTFIWQCSPFTVALVTFAVYVTASATNILDPGKAFVSISLFNILRSPLTMLPNLVTTLVLTLVSAKRITKFLNSNELVRYVSRDEEAEAISIEGGTAAWSCEDEDGKPIGAKHAVLKDIDLHVKRGSFVAVVGQVASGKSSLISSILGEMHRIAGRFNIARSLKVAYVPQQAWIQNMTVKNNILFGSSLHEDKYQQALSVCALESDLETLPGGDLAEIGEKGINLSGGQKQRVSLARACYSDSDIYLLDDPLSALDSHVAKHVFDKVLSSTTGLLRKKTRILATNSLFVLPYTDHVVVLNEGRVVESGSYSDLMKVKGGHLAEFMRQFAGTQNDVQEATPEEQADHKPAQTEVVEVLAKTKTPESRQDAGRLVEIEKLETGSVGFSIYMEYFKAVSAMWIVIVALSAVFSSVFNVSTNLWLSVWSSDKPTSDKDKDASLRTMRLTVYAIIGGLQCFTVLTGSLSLSRGAIRASRSLHASLLERIMHSPMTFFDTTPIGRIVNRFAKDIDVIDQTLPGTFRSWLICLLQVLSTFFVICYSFPSFLALLIPMGIIYYLVQRIFIITTRQLKRLESNTRSPIFSHFNETLSGSATIRAYECTNRFISSSDQLIDRNSSIIYTNVIANRWLSIRLEFFGNLITAVAAAFSVYHKDIIGAGIVGLTISYSMNITQTLSWFVRMTSDLETNIVSVERIVEYMKNKQEDLWIKQIRPPSNWPDKGAIQLQGFSTRYREETDLVLQDISVGIEPQEKVGIVGRTGSGKSSLSLSLFRVLEPATGTILIDGCDITRFGLHDIRSKLTIIPQDPVLFSGTLRFNLDPLKLYSDLDIWRALELAHLKKYMESLRNGLDHSVSEYGENFSLGQRQLICLARAILRKSKILILDEATASVDIETDSIVQKTIREIFADCTIITIAHRLHTILDSDRILVLDKGRVKELDSPTRLIADQDSVFASLIKDADIDPRKLIKK